MIKEQKDYSDSVRLNDRKPHVGSSTVVHCKKLKFDVYIGRPSKWGNPFTYKKDTIAKFILPTRQECINAYEQWITEGDGKHLLKDLHELKGKVLGCWCSPNTCHGDVLYKLANI